MIGFRRKLKSIIVPLFVFVSFLLQC